MEMVLMDAAKIDLISNSVGNDTTGGSFFHARAGLYIAQKTIIPTMTKADFDSDSATFSGYAADTITFGSPTRSDDGFYESLGTMTQFRPTDAVTPNTVWGLYVWDAANELIMAGQFDNAPLPMQSALDQILPVIRYRPTASVPVVVVT